MSTEPAPTHDAQSMTAAETTEIATRGRDDPWAATDETDASSAARAPRQFEPYSLARMRNLMDDENAYCN